MPRPSLLPPPPLHIHTRLSQSSHVSDAFSFCRSIRRDQHSMGIRQVVLRASELRWRGDSGACSSLLLNNFSSPPCRPTTHTAPTLCRSLQDSESAPPPPPPPATPVPLLSPLMTCVLSVCSPSRRPVPSSPSSPSPPDAAHSLTVVSPHGCRRRVRWRLRERALPGHLPSPT